MISESDNNDNVMTEQSDIVDGGVKRKRFSLIQREQPPSKEMRRGYDEYYNNHDNYNDETVKVEMDNNEEIRTMEMKQETKNGRGRPKKQNESHEWSDEATEALIYLWNQKEELFQKQHPYFYIREHKEKAIESIRMSLEEQGHIVTSNQILSKFQSLRTYFCSQRNKMIASKKSGLGNEDEVESKWRFYKNLMFLDENMKPRDTQTNKKYNVNRSSMQEIDYPHITTMTHVNAAIDDGIHFHPDVSHAPGSYSQNSMVVVGTHMPRETLETIPDYRKSPSEQITERMTVPTELPHSSHISHTSSHNGLSKSEDLLFGELVGNMLQQMPIGQRKDFLKLEIQQLIIKTKYALSGDIHTDKGRINYEPSNHHQT